MAKIVSKTYGEALFQIILEKEGQAPGSGEELYAEACQMMEILESNPKYDELMKHPGIAKTDKLSVAEKVFQGRLSPELYEFVRLIILKDRYGELSAIMEYVSDKMREYKRIGVAHVATAVELSDVQKKQVEGRLLEIAPFESLEMHYQVEPELIGGMVIRIGDRVVDTSVRSKLDDLTKQLLQIQLG